MKIQTRLSPSLPVQPPLLTRFSLTQATFGTVFDCVLIAQGLFGVPGSDVPKIMSLVEPPQKQSCLISQKRYWAMTLLSG